MSKAPNILITSVVALFVTAASAAAAQDREPVIPPGCQGPEFGKVDLGAISRCVGPKLEFLEANHGCPRLNAKDLAGDADLSVLRTAISSALACQADIPENGLGAHYLDRLKDLEVILAR